MSGVGGWYEKVGINGDMAERDVLDKCGRRNMNSTGECR